NRSQPQAKILVHRSLKPCPVPTSIKAGMLVPATYYLEIFPVFEAIGPMNIGLVRNHAAAITTSDAKKMISHQASVTSREVYMWLRLRNAPVKKTKKTCTTVNATK